ncbi:hypothetical protein Hanom_Chr02g00166941 [Helianthus anomalus]
MPEEQPKSANMKQWSKKVFCLAIPLIVRFKNGAVFCITIFWKESKNKSLMKTLVK